MNMKNKGQNFIHPGHNVQNYYDAHQGTSTYVEGGENGDKLADKSLSYTTFCCSSS